MIKSLYKLLWLDWLFPCWRRLRPREVKALEQLRKATGRKV